MIQPFELRIGNYYKASIEWGECFGSIRAKVYPIGGEQIFILTEEKLILILQFAPKSYEWIYPVELSEDWLINFGFIKRQTSGHKESNFEYEKDELCFSCESIENKVFHPYIYADDEFIVFDFNDLKSVHKLQNFFYEVKNKELIIK